MRWSWQATVASAALSFASAAPAEAARPRLLVMVVVDQLGSSYLDRYGSMLPGLKKISSQGAYFSQGQHATANTATGPGHANIATGAWPNEHGIVNNDWVDEATGAEAYCTGQRASGADPALLMAPTLTDTLRLATQGRAKTVAVSIKDRAAVLSGGHRPTAVAFYDEIRGTFVGATYAEIPNPPWLEGAPTAASELGKRWDRFRPTLDYETIAGRDDVPSETDLLGLGRTFPRTLGQNMKDPKDPGWNKSFRFTPQALETLFSLATKAVDTHELGRDDVPDALFIGASSLDFAGHAFGPESQETFDMLLRTDHLILELFEHLEKKIGRNQTLWMITGDHGVTPTPERATEFGDPIQRISIEDESKKIDEALLSLVPKGSPAPTVHSFDPPQLYLKHVESVSKDRARATALDALKRLPGIMEAYTADKTEFSGTSQIWFERLTFPGRRPDIFFRTNPLGFYAWALGSGHGSPHVHDMRVPIFLAGPDVPKLQDARPVDVTRIAPTLAQLLGIPAPSAAHEDPLFSSPVRWTESLSKPPRAAK